MPTILLLRTISFLANLSTGLVLGFAACSLLLFSFNSHAQEELLEDRWLTLETDNFKIFSQVSARKTQSIAEDLESWRQVAAYLIQGRSPFPKANVSNEVFIFDNDDDFDYFSAASETAFFYATPRTNFMAIIDGDELSVKEALHQYSHFLIKNFYDLRLPRWYEEGMSSYLSRIQMKRGKPELERLSKDENDLMARLNEELSMDRLLYRDEALASPRMIQVASLKSDSLLHYLMHGGEESKFSDHKTELANYLEQLLAGRNPRFAFDTSFSITTEQLDEELEDYLLTSRRPSGQLAVGSINTQTDYEISEVEGAALALSLGELALNSAGIEYAPLFFTTIIESESPYARAYSGLGDALRFQFPTGRDQEIARHFQTALEIAPNDPDILLDFGEYWEAELKSCEKSYPSAQRLQLMNDIKEVFERAIELAPSNAEAQLAMAEYYLLDEQDWQQGAAYQQRAFELLPADGFIMEQSAKYAIAAEDFVQAEALIAEMAQPIHFYGEHSYVTELRRRLLSARQGEDYDDCSE